MSVNSGEGWIDADPTRVVDIEGFVRELSRLRVQAGAPSYRTLAKRAGALHRPPRELAFRTVAAAFEPGRRRLDLDLVLAIVRALGADEGQVDQWRRAYVRATVGTNADGPPQVLRQLPSDLATFTGREDVLRRLVESAAPTQQVEAKTVVISAIEGMAGIGKTQLAVHVAHRLVRSGWYGDIQLFANLRGFDPQQPPADPAAVLETFLWQLGVPGQSIPATLDQRASKFRDRLRGKNALILLDNAADESQVRDLIPAGSGCLVLITSRRAFVGLEGARVHQLDVFDRTEAVELLGKIVGNERVSVEPDAAFDITEACGLLPLAVALAAARLRSRPAWTLADLAARLRDGGVDSVRAGERSLSAAFDLSYRGMDDDSRRSFRLLGLFPGPDFDSSAAAALTDRPLAQVEQILEELVDANLLETPSPDRYRFHDLLRDYARERAQQEDTAEELRAAQTRVAGWYLYACDLASRQVPAMVRNYPIDGVAWTTPPLEFADQHDAVAWSAAQRHNILAVVRMAAEENLGATSWLIGFKVCDIYVMNGWLQDLIEICTLGVEKSASTEQKYQAELLNLISFVHTRMGDPLGAIAPARQALELRGNSPRGKSVGALFLADALANAGQFAESFDLYDMVFTTLRAEMNIEEFAIALGNLSFALFFAGRYEDSIARAEDSLRLARENDLHHFEAAVLGGMAESYLKLNRVAEALAAAGESVRIHEQNGNASGKADALEAYADALQAAGNDAQAQVAWKEAADWFASESDPRAERIKRKMATPDSVQ